MAIKRRYFLFLCPDCGEQSQFMGFCDECNTRLTSQPAIPLAVLNEFQEAHGQRASSVPRFLNECFVSALLDYCGLRKG